MKVRVGIIGGAGYTAGELLRILAGHPSSEVVFVQSSSNAGNYVHDVHRELFGVTDQKFVGEPDFGAVDVVFLCMGHGKSIKFLEENQVPDSVRIIDLSQDFRVEGRFGSREFVYGLPEINRESIRKARNIANPGCFATAMQLALLPLAKAGLLKEEVHLNGITGSTGAGQSLSATSHFSWRNNNISVYKAFKHQHLLEVRHTLKRAAGSEVAPLRFIPVRGDFTRGIFMSAYTRYEGTIEEATALYSDFYRDAAFTFLSNQPVYLKQVVNTNRCLVALEQVEDQLLVTSIIDNLTKGASGQAVQNMNLMFSLPETEGLMLNPAAF